ncbi:MAG: hypothetical protein OEX07_07135, partial [Gammaproteobacteria bacterium]|nr:hypothetical protein [Gammaproteobacteria bacterium]
MMKKRAFNPFALSSEKSLLVLFVQLLALLFVFSNQANAQWQKITSLPATNVHLMALDPSEPNHMWVGTEYNQFNPSGSGLYHSQNNGLSWMQLNSYTSQGISLAGTPVRSISIAPDNTVNSHFMLVSFANQGIFRSTDGGMSFTETQIPNLLSPGSFLKQNVSTVVVTRALGTTRKLYAVVDADEAAIGTAGLYSATISFPTQQILWQKAGYIQDRIKKLIVDPNNANNLFVVTYGSGVGSGSRLMKSIDGGQTFTNADSGLPMGTNATITDFAVSPTISTSMYASVFQSNVKGFYKSTNGGLSWTVVNNSEVFFRIVAASLNGVQGLYGIKDKSLIGSQPQYTVYQSQNDGLTWTELDTSFQAGGLTGKTLHFLEIHNGTIFVGGDDGVFSFGNGFGGGVQNGLTVTASANPQNVQPGGQVSVTLTVTNISQNVLSSVTVTGNSLPMGSVLSSFGAQECNLSSTQVYCSFSNLSPNVPITKTLTFTMPSTLGVGSSLTFTGNATTSFGQQLSGSSAPINLGGTGQGGISNGLTINASSSTANVQPNGQVNITLSVTNTSQSLLNTVTVTGNALPLGATLSSFGAQECNLFSTQVSCTFNNLSPNVPINKTLTFTMPSTLGAGSSLTFTGNATTSFGQQLSGSSAPINLGGTGQGGVANGLTINASSSTANVQ